MRQLRPPPLSRARPRRRRRRRALGRQRAARRARRRSTNDRERRAEITPAATAPTLSPRTIPEQTARPAGWDSRGCFIRGPAMFLRHDMDELLAFDKSPAIPIYLPTQPVGREVRQDAIRLRNRLS